MRKTVWYLLFIAFATSMSFVMCSNTNGKTEAETKEIKKTEEALAIKRLRAKADLAKAYCKEKGFNTQYCILIDFSIHSGKNRFYVWDFARDTIKYESLCCHGYGNKSTQSKPVFSNIEGSYCSSLGMYKIGVRSYSSWGINTHYKMHGLEKTNNNAFKRIIVLHSHNPMPEEEIYPTHLPLGWSQGCPVISNNTMRKVDALLKDIKKPVLMWIYN